VDERSRRVGRNEAVFREVNEQIESLNRGSGAVGDEILHIVCECGDLRCVEQFVVDVDVYERIRAEPTMFLVLPGHERPDVERVVEQAETYHVVKKLEGVPGLVARESDPRGG
jgi:hypothetical protein